MTTDEQVKQLELRLEKMCKDHEASLRFLMQEVQTIQDTLTIYKMMRPAGMNDAEVKVHRKKLRKRENFDPETEDQKGFLNRLFG